MCVRINCQHTTVLIISPFILETIIIAEMMSTGKTGNQSVNQATNTTQQRPFYVPLSGTTRVSRYQKKHSPTHHPDHYPIFISFFHLPRSITSSLFKLRAWQSYCTTSFHVLFGLPLGLEPRNQTTNQSQNVYNATCYK